VNSADYHHVVNFFYDSDIQGLVEELEGDMYYVGRGRGIMTQRAHYLFYFPKRNPRYHNQSSRVNWKYQHLITEILQHSLPVALSPLETHFFLFDHTYDGQSATSCIPMDRPPESSGLYRLSS
jgi:hypothetical protein